VVAAPWNPGTIPRKANERRRGRFNKALYKLRARIEQLINRWLIGSPKDEPGFVTGISGSLRVGPTVAAMRDRGVISGRSIAAGARLSALRYHPGCCAASPRRPCAAFRCSYHRGMLMVASSRSAMQLPAARTAGITVLPRSKRAVLRVLAPADGSPAGRGYPGRVLAGTPLLSHDRRHGSAPGSAARWRDRWTPHRFARCFGVSSVVWASTITLRMCYYTPDP